MTDTIEARFFGTFKKEDWAAIKMVTLGGFLGGLLQPAVAQLNPAQNNPTVANILLGPFLGVAAAGIAVFVLANSKTDNKMRLLFFSLLCGLAFPAVLTSAVEGVNSQSREVAARASQIATEVVAGNASAAAKDLTTTMLATPSAEAQLESTAQSVVSKLADRAEASGGANADKAIAELKQIGTAAHSAGYDGTALRVAKELRKIEASKEAGSEQKEVAGDAANEIIGLPLVSPAPR
jgi:hypothetical protein